MLGDSLRSSDGRRWLRGLIQSGIGLAAVLCATPAPALPGQPQRLIVKYQGQGRYALEDCAQALFRSGRDFRGATADRSESLDRVHRGIGVKGIRALFRSSDGRSLDEQRRDLHLRLAARSRGAVPPDLSHVYALELAGDVTSGEAIAALESDPHVAYVQIDHTYELESLVDGQPNDPFFSSAGAWGQAFADLWGLQRIRAPEAWSITRGAGIVVAVVDTGLDYDHPDIRENVWINPGEDLDGNGRVDASDWNGIDDDANGLIDDLRGFDFASSIDANDDGDYADPGDVNDPDPFDGNGHGTHVAGTIAARGDNGIGIVGVAPEAKIMALKGFPDAGPGRDSVLWRAVLHAALQGASVVNNSWSCVPECPRNPLAREIVGLLHDMDVVVVTSAGNRSADVIGNVPENMREVITVASSDTGDLPSSDFTNWGWQIDVAAPGGGPNVPSTILSGRRNILSLRSAGGDPGDPFVVASDYLRNAGTSMAAPHVAGVVALLQSAYPGIGYESVRRRLRQSALDLGAPGHDPDMGGGRLDAYAALTDPELPDLVARIDGPAQGGVVRTRDGAVAIVGTASGDDYLQHELSFGFGARPTSWTPLALARSGRVEDEVMASWDPAGLEVGPYVIRLRVEANDGSVFEEFLQLDIEENVFVQLSPFGPPATKADIAAGRVVWQSARDAETAADVAADLNLFMTDLSSGRVSPLVLAPGDQEDASLSRTVVAWRDGRRGLSEPEIYTCQLPFPAPRAPLAASSSTASCDASVAAGGALPRSAPVAVQSLVVWGETDPAGTSDLRACALTRGAGCRPVELGLAPARRLFPWSDGRRLVYHAFDSGHHIETCAIRRRAPWDRRLARVPLCAPRSVLPPIAVTSFASASDSIVAWSSSMGLAERLFVCRPDPVTGACPPVLVAPAVTDVVHAVSGNRVVWEARVGGEQEDVFFCEYDELLGGCPGQRLTSHRTRQHQATIDGDWVVWTDGRLGAEQIFGLELPSLSVAGRRRVRAGEQLTLRARGDAASFASLTLGVSSSEHSLAELGVRFVDRENGHADFTWRPGEEWIGDHVFTFTATSESGIVVRKSVRIVVDTPRRRPSQRGWLEGWRAWLRFVGSSSRRSLPASS